MVIAIDFDGTLHNAPWPHIGNPLPYVVDVMNKLKADGHYLIIWTCREHQYLTEAVNWLLEKGIPFDRVNDHKVGAVEQFGYAARKVYADIYIDDKQIGGLPMWKDIYNYVTEIQTKLCV